MGPPLRTLQIDASRSNLLFDSNWSYTDPDRQALRDRFSFMCLVKERAEPIGTVPVHLTYFNALGYTFIYPRVVHSRTDTANTSD